MYSAPRKPLAERLWAKVKEGSTQPLAMEEILCMRS